jgi:hypothetical protein
MMKKILAFMIFATVQLSSSAQTVTTTTSNQVSENAFSNVEGIFSAIGWGLIGVFIFILIYTFYKVIKVMAKRMEAEFVRIK